MHFTGWFDALAISCLSADENMQGIGYVVGQGCVDRASVGRKTILACSHTGGCCYFQKNFKDGLVICRVHGAPTLFTTFTCNPKWHEITEVLLLEPWQKPMTL